MQAIRFTIIWTLIFAFYAFGNAQSKECNLFIDKFETKSGSEFILKPLYIYNGDSLTLPTSPFTEKEFNFIRNNEKGALIFDGDFETYANPVPLFKIKVKNRLWLLIVQGGGMYYPSQTHAILFDAKNCKVNKSKLVAEDWGDAGEGYYVESVFIKTGKKISLRYFERYQAPAGGDFDPDNYVAEFKEIRSLFSVNENEFILLHVSDTLYTE